MKIVRRRETNSSAKLEGVKLAENVQNLIRQQKEKNSLGGDVKQKKQAEMRMKRKRMIQEELRVHEK